MDEKLQNQIAFYLTGRRAGSALRPLDRRFRPALFARYADLTSLRYDFPLILNRQGTAGWAILSLSQLVDQAIEELAERPDRDRIARHAYRLERELRSALAAAGGGDFASMWNSAAARLADAGDETVKDSAGRLWTSFSATGELVDADCGLPTRAVRHVWNAVHAGKTKAFRKKAERLLLKLRNILEAEIVGSAAGRTPEKLRAGVGSSFAATFDFDRMSRILGDAKPGAEIPDERRNRIRGLIGVLERQRFFPLGDPAPEAYNFAFERCAEALTAYQERHEEAVELAKTLAVAELEVNGDYRESVHNNLFEGFGANGLDSGELAELPDYLICTDAQSLDPFETAQLVELLAAGLPVKVLVRTDDVLEPSFVAEGHLALGLRARQLVDTAIGLTGVFVFQSAASQIFRMRDLLVSGLTFDGPSLFSVFSGENSHTNGIPAYLVAAAAIESRVFPTLVYDPSAGSDWAARLRVDGNPEPGDDWPLHNFTYEGLELQARSEELAFTLADFLAMDERFFAHFAILPEAEWSGAIITVPEALQTEAQGTPDKVPGIALVDDEGRLQRAIIDNRTLSEVRRCRTMWHSLQELGGIHNSHAERLLAEERKARAVIATAPAVDAALEAPDVAVPAAVAEMAVTAPAAEVSSGDDPYIETERCTTCNECTQINSKLFAYNENKQAYIADPDAGTFRELVEAAEGCQVSIIHPGKPRNPKEPGLEDLLRRAAGFI